jgi:hypothetical protein
MDMYGTGVGSRSEEVFPENHFFFFFWIIVANEWRHGRSLLWIGLQNRYSCFLRHFILCLFRGKPVPASPVFIQTLEVIGLL